MTQIFKRNLNSEPFVLGKNHQINEDYVRIMTNFHLDGVRFLFKHYTHSMSCILNDHHHMGKTIQLIAMISAIIKSPVKKGGPVMICCYDENQILKWTYLLELLVKDVIHFFFDYRQGIEENIMKMKERNCDILFVMYNPHFNWSLTETINVNYLIFDSRNMPLNDICFDFLHKIKCQRQVFVASDDLEANPSVLKILIKTYRKLNYQKGERSKIIGGYFKLSSIRLRRLNEQFLLEFPWIDKQRFITAFQNWKNSRDPEDALSKCSQESERPASILLFESEDESTLIQSSQQPSGTMDFQLKISQVFDSNLGEQTPCMRQTSKVDSDYENSPDLFAMIENDDEEETLVGISTPVLSSNAPFIDFSQSPIIRPKSQLMQALCGSQALNQSEVFEITSNNIFPNIIKLTSDEEMVPMEVRESTPKKNRVQGQGSKSSKSPRRPKSASRIKPTTPSTGTWLSKDKAKKSPQKLIAMKKRKLELYFEKHSLNKSSSCGELEWNDSFDATQKWPVFNSTRQKLVIVSSDEEM